MFVVVGGDGDGGTQWELVALWRCPAGCISIWAEWQLTLTLIPPPQASLLHHDRLTWIDFPQIDARFTALQIALRRMHHACIFFPWRPLPNVLCEGFFTIENDVQI
jgi:hypothetical protein